MSRSLTDVAGAPADVTTIGAAAATVLARAVLAAVHKATSLACVTAVRDMAPDDPARQAAT